MTDDKTRIHATLNGRVQGVFFRAETRAAARRRGVCGWVRNMSDGRVEAVFEGRAQDVAQLVQWCRDGPPNARVDDIHLKEGSYTGEFDGFSIRR
jgi:acylphosphatase